MKRRFGKTDVAITLTGEEWFAICTTLTGMPLSQLGMQVLATAGAKLRKQLTAVAELQQTPEVEDLGSTCEQGTDR